MFQTSRFILSCSVIACIAPLAHADTIYKCTDAKGKIAFSDTPCAATSKSSKTMEVIAPMDAAEAAVRASDDLRQMKTTSEQLQKQREERDRLEDEARRKTARQNAERASSRADDEKRKEWEEIEKGRAAVREGKQRARDEEDERARRR